MQITKSKKQYCLKAVAFSLLVCFTFTSTARSAPEITVQSQRLGGDRIVVPLAERIEIPEILGTIHERFIPDTTVASAQKSGLPFIALIQDAHSQYEAQMNTKHILEHLTQDYGIDLIFIEGGIGKLNPFLLKFFKNPRLNQKVADLMAKDSVIGGPEIFLLDQILHPNTKPPLAYGVEDPELYRKNLRLFRGVLNNKEKIDQYLQGVHSTLLTQASHIFNKRLADFFKEWLFYQDISGEWMRHLYVLNKYANEELQIDLNDARQQFEWPQLVRFFALHQIEQSIEPGKVKEDQRRLVKWARENRLKKRDIQGIAGILNKKAISITSHQTPRELLQKFYEAASPKGFSFHQYPHFAKQAGLVILQSELKASELFTEMEKITDRLLSKLAAADAERKLIFIFKDYLLLKKLLALELTHEEYEQARVREKNMKPSVLANRLQSITSTPLGTDKTKDHSRSTMDSPFEHALAFYEAAQARETAIVNRMLSTMKETKRTNAILIAGGFHTEGLARQLESHTFSHVEITPQISKIEGAQNYTKVMTLQEDPYTLKSYLRFFSRIQPLGDITLTKLGRQEAFHGAMGINSAVGRALAEDPSHFKEQIEEINESVAYRQHGLRYITEMYGNKEAEVLYLGNQKVRIQDSNIGITSQGPRRFSEEDLKTSDANSKMLPSVSEAIKILNTFSGSLFGLQAALFYLASTTPNGSSESKGEDGNEILWQSVEDYVGGRKSSKIETMVDQLSSQMEFKIFLEHLKPLRSELRMADEKDIKNYGIVDEWEKVTAKAHELLRKRNPEERIQQIAMVSQEDFDKEKFQVINLMNAPKLGKSYRVYLEQNLEILFQHYILNFEMLENERLKEKKDQGLQNRISKYNLQNFAGGGVTSQGGKIQKEPAVATYQYHLLVKNIPSNENDELRPTFFIVFSKTEPSRSEVRSAQEVQQLSVKINEAKALADKNHYQEALEIARPTIDRLKVLKDLPENKSNMPMIQVFITRGIKTITDWEKKFQTAEEEKERKRQGDRKAFLLAVALRGNGLNNQEILARILKALDIEDSQKENLVKNAQTITRLLEETDTFPSAADEMAIITSLMPLGLEEADGNFKPSKAIEEAAKELRKKAGLADEEEKIKKSLLLAGALKIKDFSNSVVLEDAFKQLGVTAADRSEIEKSAVMIAEVLNESILVATPEHMGLMDRLRNFGVEINEGDVTFSFTPELKKEIESFKEIVGIADDESEFDDPIPEPKVIPFNFQTNGKNTLSHTEEEEIELLIKAHHAIRLHKQEILGSITTNKNHPDHLRAMDEQKNGVVPSLKELARALGWEESRVQAVLTRIHELLPPGVSPERQKLQTLEDLNKESIKELSDNDYKRILAISQTIEVPIHVGNPYVSQTVDEKSFEDAKSFFENVRSGWDDVWRLFYVLLPDSQWDFLTDVISGSGPDTDLELESPAEKQRIISLYHDLKEHQLAWQAYHILYYGGILPEKMIQAILADKNNYFLDFLYQIRNFFSARHDYFKYDDFINQIGHAILPFEKTTELTTEEVSARLEPFSRALEDLSSDVNTEGVVQTFLRQVSSYAKAHYQDKTISEDLDHFLERSTDFLNLLTQRIENQNGHKNPEDRQKEMDYRVLNYLRLPLEHFQSELVSFILKDATKLSLVPNVDIQNYLATFIKKSDPAYFVLLELMSDGALTRRQLDVLGLIASNEEFAQERDLEALAHSLAAELLVHDLNQETQVAIEGRRVLNEIATPWMRKLTAYVHNKIWQFKNDEWVSRLPLLVSDTAHKDLELNTVVANPLDTEDRHALNKVLDDAQARNIIDNHSSLMMKMLINNPDQFYQDNFRKDSDPDKLIKNLLVLLEQLENSYKDLPSKLFDFMSRQDLDLYRHYPLPFPPFEGMNRLAKWIDPAFDPRNLQAFLYRRGYRYLTEGPLAKVISSATPIENGATGPQPAKASKEIKIAKINAIADDMIISFFIHNTLSTSAYSNWEDFYKGLIQHIRFKNDPYFNAEEVLLVFSIKFEEYIKEKLKALHIDAEAFAIRRAYEKLDAEGEETTLPKIYNEIPLFLGRHIVEVGEGMGKLNDLIKQYFKGDEKSSRRHEMLVADKWDVLPNANPKQAEALFSSQTEKEKKIISAYYQALEKSNGLPPTKRFLLEVLEPDPRARGKAKADFEALLARVNRHLRTVGGYAPLRIAPPDYFYSWIIETFKVWKQANEKQPNFSLSFDTLFKALEEGKKLQPLDEKKLAEFLNNKKYTPQWELIKKIYRNFEVDEYTAEDGLKRYAEILDEEKKEAQRKADQEREDYTEDDLELAGLTIHEFVNDARQARNKEKASTPEKFIENLAKEITGSGATKLRDLALQKAKLTLDDMKIIWAFHNVPHEGGVAKISDIAQLLKKHGRDVLEENIFETFERANNLLNQPVFRTQETAYLTGKIGEEEQILAKIYYDKIKYSNDYATFLQLVRKQRLGSRNLDDSELEAESNRIKSILKWNLKLEELDWYILRAYWDAGGNGTKGISLSTLLNKFEDLTEQLETLQEDINNEKLDARIKHIQGIFNQASVSIGLQISDSAKINVVEKRKVLDIRGATDYWKALFTFDELIEIEGAKGGLPQRRALWLRHKDKYESKINRTSSADYDVAYLALKSNTIILNILYEGETKYVSETVGRDRYNEYYWQFISDFKAVYQKYQALKNGRAEVRAQKDQPEDLKPTDYGIVQNWDDVITKAHELLRKRNPGERIQQVAMTSQENYASGNYPVISLMDAPRLGKSYRVYLEQNLEILFLHYIGAPLQNTKKEKTTEGKQKQQRRTQLGDYRYHLFVKHTALSKKEEEKPTLIIVFSKEKLSARSEVRSFVDAKEMEGPTNQLALEGKYQEAIDAMSKIVSLLKPLFTNGQDRLIDRAIKWSLRVTSSKIASLETIKSEKEAERKEIAAKKADENILLLAWGLDSKKLADTQLLQKAFSILEILPQDQKEIIQEANLIIQVKEWDVIYPSAEYFSLIARLQTRGLVTAITDDGMIQVSDDFEKKTQEFWQKLQQTKISAETVTPPAPIVPSEIVQPAAIIPKHENLAVKLTAQNTAIQPVLLKLAEDLSRGKDPLIGTPEYFYQSIEDYRKRYAEDPHSLRSLTELLGNEDRLTFLREGLTQLGYGELEIVKDIIAINLYTKGYWARLKNKKFPKWKIQDIVLRLDGYRQVFHREGRVVASQLKAQIGIQNDHLLDIFLTVLKHANMDKNDITSDWKLRISQEPFKQLDFPWETIHQELALELDNQLSNATLDSSLAKPRLSEPEKEGEPKKTDSVPSSPLPTRTFKQNPPSELAKRMFAATGTKNYSEEKYQYMIDAYRRSYYRDGGRVTQSNFAQELGQKPSSGSWAFGRFATALLLDFIEANPNTSAPIKELKDLFYDKKLKSKEKLLAIDKFLQTDVPHAKLTELLKELTRDIKPLSERMAEWHKGQKGELSQSSFQKMIDSYHRLYAEKNDGKKTATFKISRVQWASVFHIPATKKRKINRLWSVFTKALAATGHSLEELGQGIDLPETTPDSVPPVLPSSPTPSLPTPSSLPVSANPPVVVTPQPPVEKPKPSAPPTPSLPTPSSLAVSPSPTVVTPQPPVEKPKPSAPPTPSLPTPSSLAVSPSPTVVTPKPPVEVPPAPEARKTEPTQDEIAKTAAQYDLTEDMAKKLLKLHLERLQDTEYRYDTHTEFNSLMRWVQQALVYLDKAARPGENLVQPLIRNDPQLEDTNYLKSYWRGESTREKDPRILAIMKTEAIESVTTLINFKYGEYRSETISVKDRRASVDQIRMASILRFRQVLRDRYQDNPAFADEFSPEEDYEFRGKTSTDLALSVLQDAILSSELLQEEKTMRDPYFVRLVRAERWTEGGKTFDAGDIPQIKDMLRQAPRKRPGDDRRSEVRSTDPKEMAARLELTRYLKTQLGLHDIQSVLEVAQNARWIFDEATVRSLGNLITPFIPQVYADQTSALSQEETTEAMTILKQLQTNKEIIAPFVHIRNINDTLFLEQLFESANLIVATNQVKAHHIVFIVDKNESVDPLHDKLMQFLTLQYPQDFRKRNEIYSHFHIFTLSNRLISNFIPRGAKTVWVDWLPEGESHETAPAPERARETQIYANRVITGEHLSFNEKNKGYAASLLQAVKLLLDPEKSELQKSKQGPYVQKSFSALLTFGNMFTALQRISTSA